MSETPTLERPVPARKLREPGLEVRHALGAREEAALETAGLRGRAPAEAWTVHGTSRRLAEGTHGIFRYFGKFPPPVARELIGRYTVPGDGVLDPLAGSGTTAVEALRLGRHATARDISPLALLLCRVKTTHVPLAASLAALERVEARALAAATLPCVPTGLRNPEHWFLPATLASLGRLRAAIEPESDEALRELLLAAFASSVRRVSRATTEQGRLFLDAQSAREDALPTFRERFTKHATAVAGLPSGAEATSVRVERQDVKVPSERGGSFPLVVAHPPYFNNYKYSAINALELAWLGFAPADVRPHEIRESFKVGKPERASEYVVDLLAALAALEAELAPGGHLALMMGDTVIRDAYVDVTRRLLEALEARGSTLALERIALRVPKYTEASWVASQRRTKGRVGVSLSDFVLVFARRRGA